MNIQVNAAHLMEKWNKVIDHPDLPKITDHRKRRDLAILLENQLIDIKEQAAGSAGFSGQTSLITEAASAPTNNYGGGNIAGYDPILITLVRRSAPNLIAYDLCGVQPMTGPTGLIFAFKSRYSSMTGAEALFNEANTSFSATAKGNNSHQTANSHYTVQTGSDPTLLSAGTEYTATDGTSTAFAEALGSVKPGNEFQEMAMDIGKVTVTAVSRALKAEYSIELAQDLKALHGLEAESELSNILTNELLAEQNREVIRKLYITATVGAQTNVATAGTFDLDVDSNGRWTDERFKGLAFEIEKEANAVARATRKGKANFLLCGSDVASALASLGRLTYTPAMTNNLQVDDTGNTFAGIFGNMRVYIDPYFATSAGNQIVLVGYKGSNPFDAGMFYCPYVPLQMMRAVGENTFQPKIAFKTRYGLVANPFATTAADGVITFANKNIYYRRFIVSNLM